MSNTLLTLSGVGKSFKEVEALTKVDLEITSGQVVGLVGGNGAGKTTLLRLMAELWSHQAQFCSKINPCLR